MNKETKTIEFISFCIEMYAKKHAVSGSYIAQAFEKAALIDFLMDNYEELHTQGENYIIPLLEEKLQDKITC